MEQTEEADSILSERLEGTGKHVPERARLKGGCWGKGRDEKGLMGNV